ncbi:MAG: PilZ domain-containing protein [Nitrospira sp.]|nr:PilZ domain-containing protein [Nitrospira sp.]
MNITTTNNSLSDEALTRESNRRHNDRMPTIFSLQYSGMDASQMVIGDGVVTNLSPGGVGIRGSHPVKPGMELALFVDLPGVDEPLCIAQCHVTWIDGRRFGVQFGPLQLEEKNHLRFFLWDLSNALKADRRV